LALNGLAARLRPAPARLALAGLVLLVLLILTLYAARTMIAERLARRWFEGRQVPAGFTVQSLSLTGLTAQLRLGPAANPDLTVTRLQVAYALGWDGRQVRVQTRSIRLWRPRLKAKLINGRLSLGGLDGLIRELSRQPAAPGRAPDIFVDDGVLTLSTPQGLITVEGGGALRGGRLSAAHGGVAPLEVAVSGMRVRSAGGAFRLDRHGERLAGTIDLGPITAAGLASRVSLARAKLAIEAPEPSAAGRVAGPVSLTLAADGAAAETPSLHAAGAAVEARLQGMVDGDAHGVTARAEGTAIAQGSAVRLADAAVERLGVRLQLQTFAAQADAHGVRASAAFSGALVGRGRLAPAAAQRLAERLPVLGAEPPYRQAAARAFEAFRLSAPAWIGRIDADGLRFSLTAPLAFQSASGARLTIAGGTAQLGHEGATGSGAVTVGGGGLPSIRAELPRWSAAPSGLEADVKASGALDAWFARGAQASAVGHASLAGGLFRFRLAACAPVTAQRLAVEPEIEGFAGRICPGAAPLIEASQGGVAAEGRIEDARGAAPGFAARIAGARGVFRASLSKRLDAASLTLDQGLLSDAAASPRFRPMIGTGRLDFAEGLWRGDLDLATPAGRSVAKVALRHDAVSGTGRADIDARQLTFDVGGLQPSDLTPLGSFARQAAGDAAFTGWFAWGPTGALTSGGELKAPDLRFRSPAGLALGIAGDVKFASLAPLVTAPGQTLAVREVQSLLPLEHLAATFAFDAKTASLDTASADFAHGQVRLEPMSVTFAQGSTTKGMLVFDHVDLGQVIAATSLAHAASVDAVVDGRIPFEIGPAGLHITAGELKAVRPGRISIARAAIGGAGATDVARDFAYQAMENLAFDTLEADLDSIEGDRLRVLFKLKGRHDPPQKVRARIAVSDLVAGTALKKPIPLPSGTTIDLTLDTTLNFGELMRAFGEAWREGLGGGEAGAPHSAPVQGPAVSMPTR
jgi:hypothetical protein